MTHLTAYKRALLCGLLAALPSVASASSFKSLYSFQGNVMTGFTDGAYPAANLVAIGDMLYGTTNAGVPDYGTIFAINRHTGAESEVYGFQNSTDGAYPLSGLINIGGILYGTAQEGGTSGNGTIFSFNPANNAFTTLFSFDGTDGARANAGLVHSGNYLYGVASFGGGVNNDGVVYSYDLLTGTQKVLHSFSGADGAVPFCPLVDHGGKLYGTTAQTLAASTGVVFSINHVTGKETVLHIFGDVGDGALPTAGLLYSGGLLYGTTNYGGNTGNGVVFALDPVSQAETILYSFTGGADGGNPAAGVIMVGGMLYGTTSAGGTGRMGTVFQVDPATGVETVIHAFSGPDGAVPGGSLLYTGGKLYGTTTIGGTQNFGTVFSVTP